MSADRPGWPAHRPRCRARDEAVETKVAALHSVRWLLRRCTECWEVALTPEATQPTLPGGDAA